MPVSIPFFPSEKPAVNLFDIRQHSIKSIKYSYMNGSLCYSMKHERWPLSFSYILCNIAIRRLPSRFVMIMGYIEEILTITNKKTSTRSFNSLISGAVNIMQIVLHFLAWHKHANSVLFIACVPWHAVEQCDLFCVCRFLGCSPACFGAKTIK